MINLIFSASPALFAFDDTKLEGHCATFLRSWKIDCIFIEIFFK